METININRPITPFAFLPAELKKSAPEPANDALLLQQHRERLLESAKISAASATQAGCVSDISIVDNIVDSDEYQNVLKEISRLLQSSSGLAQALESLDLQVEIKINDYDDSGMFESGYVDFTAGDCRVSDSDDEAIGYLAWIAC